MTPLGFIGTIRLHIDAQLFRPVSELALLAIGTEPFFHEISAERTFGLGRDAPSQLSSDKLDVLIYVMLTLISLRRGIRVRVTGQRQRERTAQHLVIHHVVKVINDYSFADLDLIISLP